jgi:hypothetical protein
MLILALFIHFSCVEKIIPKSKKKGWIRFESIIPLKSSFIKLGCRKNAPIMSH